MIGGVIGYSVLGMALVMLARQQRWTAVRQWMTGLLVTYVTITLILLAGEAYFRFAYAESDGLPTLASRNWLGRYWQTNTQGYRDREWQAEDWQDKQTVLVLGDSFAAGWGIENPEDRFADVMAAGLGDGVAVINLGKEGTNTVDQTAILDSYPLPHPDVVVLQYYLNDIEHAALSLGLDPGLDPTRNLPGWANESYLANFLYWRLAPRLQPGLRGEQTYWGWLYSMYDNSSVWDIHRQELEAFIAAVEARDAQLMVVIFPNMLDAVGSIPYLDRVAQVFESRGYDERYTLKLFDQAEQMPLNERIVSPRDAHASAAFNRLVGDLLAERVVQLLQRPT